MAEMKFKPNVYPIMYWGLMFGLIAGFLLFVVLLLSRYVTVIWFPVFLTGVIWGGWRNYRKQKKAWQESAGQPSEVSGVVEEVKEAAQDIVAAAREVMSEEEDVTPTTPPEETSDQSRNNLPPA